MKTKSLKILNAWCDKNTYIILGVYNGVKQYAFIDPVEHLATACLPFHLNEASKKKIPTLPKVSIVDAAKVLSSWLFYEDVGVLPFEERAEEASASSPFTDKDSEPAQPAQ